MAKKLECVFRAVNGTKTGCHARSKPTKNSTSHGILYMVKCPDGKTFYCDPNSGSGNYKKLLEPTKYGLPNKEIYVYVAPPHIESQKIIDDVVGQSSATPTPKNPPSIPGNKNTVPPPSPFRTQSPKNEERVNFDSSLGGTSRTTPDSDVSLFTVESIDLDTNNAFIRWRSLNKHDNRYYHYNGSTFHNDYTFIDSSTIDDPMSAISRNFNIFTHGLQLNQTLWEDTMKRFNRFNMDFPGLKLDMSHAHVFFTRPDLNLFKDKNTLLDDVKYLGDMYYMFENNRDILRSLTKDYFYGEHGFNPLMTNYAKSFELSDANIDTSEVGETMVGHKIKYGQSNIKSKTAGSFTVRFDDDSQLRLLKMLKVYVDYISRVYRGELKSKERYIKERILDYPISVYYILCGPDNETIIMWSKYTGAFPVNVPYSQFGWNSGDNVRLPSYNISFDFAWKDDFNPLHLVEFNSLSAGLQNSRYIAQYEPLLNSTGKVFMDPPFIDVVKGKDGMGYNFKLRYRPKKNIESLNSGNMGDYGVAFTKNSLNSGRIYRNVPTKQSTGFAKSKTLLQSDTNMENPRYTKRNRYSNPSSGNTTDFNFSDGGTRDFNHYSGGSRKF